ncbi:MAG: hypothetical protein FWG09_02000, partial [Synergistaceae bacterium]|nr:hypothetical protein [Synergistaceae bacterium]
MFKSILKGAGVGVGLWIVNKLAGTKNHETENQKGRDNQDWGYNMGAGNTTGAVRELTAKLEEFESRRGQSSNFFAQMFSDDSNISTTDKQKINLIRSFPIPNTKEDIFEFIILAASNVQETAYETNKKGSADRKLSDAWLAKLEQAYHKAKFTFGNSSDFYS